MKMFLAFVVLLVLAAMIWDQRRLGSMYWWKWPIAALMLGIMEAVVLLS